MTFIHQPSRRAGTLRAPLAPVAPFAVAALVVLVSLVGSATAPAAAQPQGELEAVLVAYLQEDCGVGEPSPTDTLTAILRQGDRAVPLLASAVRKGPPDDVVRAVREDAAADYARLREYLAGDGLDGLDDPELREQARQLDRDTYIDQRLRSVVRGYRERGANALVALQSDAARDALRRLAGEGDEETREIVRRAIDDGPNRGEG